MSVTPTIAASGIQACTVNTLHTLATITTAGVYCGYVSIQQLVGGTTPDILEVYLYKTLVPSGVSLLFDSGTFVGGMIVYSGFQTGWMDVLAGETFLFQIKQTQGTSRNIPWEVVSV